MCPRRGLGGQVRAVSRGCVVGYADAIPAYAVSLFTGTAGRDNAAAKSAFTRTDSPPRPSTASGWMFAVGPGAPADLTFVFVVSCMSTPLAALPAPHEREGRRLRPLLRMATRDTAVGVPARRVEVRPPSRCRTTAPRAHRAATKQAGCPTPGKPYSHLSTGVDRWRGAPTRRAPHPDHQLPTATAVRTRDARITRSTSNST